MRPSSRRTRARHTRAIVLTIALFVVLVGGVTAALGAIRRPAAPDRAAAPSASEPSPASESPSPPRSPSPSPSPSRRGGTTAPANFPRSGPGTWQYADDQSPVFGAAGPVLRFRVAVETGVPYPVEEFAEKVQDTLGDRRSWTAGGTFRLQQVPRNASAQFTIYLATRQTRRRMCAAGGLDTGGFTSCRISGQVIINLDRWYLSVSDYVKNRIPLDTYRTYVINHETGHQFGHGHELCPAPGRPAPVMQQ